MIVPNLLLLGAPKCATSTLHAALCAHPEIAQGVRKELFFLMDPQNPLKGAPNVHDDGIGAYASLFPGAADRSAVRVDSTTHYLYQQTALDFARQHSEVRACIVLRDPAERVYSSFNYTRNNLATLARDLSFARFIDLLDSGEPLYPRYCRSSSSAWVLERDIEFSRYRRHLAPWLDEIGPDRVRIVLFDDLKTDLSSVTASLCGWLGLGPAAVERASASPRNVTREVRYQSLHRLVRRFNAAVPLPSTLKSHLMAGYNTLQGGSPDRRGDVPDVARLRQRFGDDIEWLSRLLQRDLSHWRGEGKVR